ncbi:unnamed protein product [Musa acuminata subsp. malaccensis]|uniref:(wild Malaysian banana) hypothetical protein n=1 Tax=Musa acuminata subsp. malaccensis TaxID=214687 RepID=A0A804J9A0_MUSAM|nr:PREDICTED: uncharacterized protein LOC103986423 [Musa acuminata subsp. malaccensis]CAG1840048.1 unnamed protein product [Musa acuminata subsp. malaccensis]
MFQNQLSRTSSFRGSLKGLEADISHANSLAETIQRAYGGPCLHMRLSCSPLAPFFLFLIQYMGCSCSYSLLSYLCIFQIMIYKVYVDGTSSISTYERRASLREFYAVVYPSLQQLDSNLMGREECSERGQNKEIVGRKRMEDRKKASDKDLDREDECGICLEVCTKMVLPSCSHAMCLKCYRDWDVRSQSCPFCRGSLKRIRSRDLWVLTSNGDVVDNMTLEKDNVRRLYRYIDSLPLIIPDTLFFVYYDQWI